MPSKDDADRAASLLLKALGSLSDRDRELVMRNLLTGGIGSSGSREPSHPSVIGPPRVLKEARLGMEVIRQAEQPLLVRLPSDLHARFRRWTTSHGFSMASVVRGLVERFLDDQEGRGRAGGGGSKG